MQRFTTYLTHKVATHRMNTVIKITATIRPRGSVCRGSLASEIFNFDIFKYLSICLRVHHKRHVVEISINCTFLTIIISGIIVNTNIILKSTSLVSRFAWQCRIAKFKVFQDSIMIPQNTTCTIVT